MYPQQELNRLGGVKQAVRKRIARRRAETIELATRAARPLEWVDRIHGQWQRFAPFAKLAAGPVGIWLLRSFAGKRRAPVRWMSWLPTIWTVVRGFRGSRSGRETG